MSPALPWEGKVYSIKQHGLTIANCDREPVQTPGCVQAYGALLVVRARDLTISQVSENCADHLGLVPADLLEKRIGEVTTPEIEAAIAAEMQRGKLEGSPRWVASLRRTTEAPVYDVIVHTSGDLVIVEFVPEVKPESQRIDYYEMVKSAVGRLQTAPNISQFSEILSEEVRTITGLDRAMIYRFHRDHHGEVFAESRRPDLPSWKGLHYPAEDIPQPARAIFQRIWIRPVPDISGELAELTPLASPDTGQALPMTFCVLRGASVMYTEYLKNMHVTAALTMSLRDGEKLWGMIACHHYSGPYYLGTQARAACELLAQIASLLIRKIEDREHLLQRLEIDGVHQQLLARAALEGDITALVHGGPSLLAGIPAGGVALRAQGRWWRAGATPEDEELEALAEWLAGQESFCSPLQPHVITDALARDYSGGAAIAAQASGVLAIPIGDPRTSLLIWFRPETIQTVHWAGNPHDKPMITGPHGPRLTPRASFELFVESVKQRSLPWESAHLAAALQLRQYIRDIVVNRADQLALLNAQLTQSNEELEAFAHIASHDLKEPLRGIYKYGSQLLEECTAENEGQRRRLENIVRLTERMNSLLDSLLHYSRLGRNELRLEVVNLNDVLEEAKDLIAARALEKPGFSIVTPRPLPEHRCDPIRLREIFTNLLSNALKYSDKPEGCIAVGYWEPDDSDRPPAMPEDARGERVFFVRDEGIGISERHFEHVFELFRRLHDRTAFGGGTGVGLAIVKRAVERHAGQVWLASKVGSGTTVYFTLPIQKETPTRTVEKAALSNGPQAP